MRREMFAVHAEGIEGYIPSGVCLSRSVTPEKEWLPSGVRMVYNCCEAHVCIH